MKKKTSFSQIVGSAAVGNVLEYYDFTFRFSSMTGDVSNDATQLFVSTTVNYYKAQWYYQDDGQCGCYSWNSCCNCWNGGCCGYNYQCSCNTGNNCTYYLGYDTFLLTGGSTQAWVPGRSLASSYSIDLVSRQYSV